ncbi:MAG: hypothetical protein ACQESP_02615 [Candidatus Muiribacteriota bacterium]
MWNVNMMDEMSKQWEKMLKQWFDELMQNPEFLQNMGKSMETAFTSKIIGDEIKNKMADSFSLPTREMVAKLGRQLIRQEAKINQLEDLILELKDDLKKLNKK